MNKIRVRFAPSPTGPLHIGGARTTLFNYLFARQNNGVFVVRVEDTDMARSQKVFEQNIFDGLKWLGFEPDEIYHQSDRMDVYKEYAQKLTDAGLTYEQDGGLIFKIPTDNRALVVDDIIRGKVEFNSKDFDDIVLFKKDGMPTFHFANVVDDLTMQITHVIRGEDHLSNTPKHIMLFQAFDVAPPIYAHIPLILNEDRSKMSKRSGDTALSEYIAAGYLPEAMINFLVHLGWSDKDAQEFFTLEELLKKFDLSRVQKGGAVFNIKHLNHLNHHYLMQKPLDEYIELAKPYVASVSPRNAEELPLLRAALKLIQDRAQTLSEIPDLISFFFQLPPYEAELLVFKKSSPEQTLKGLSSAHKVLEVLEEGEWTMEKLQQVLDATLAAESLNPGDLFWPVRVALSGNSASPSPVELLEALGKTESLERIKTALVKIN
jgi:glutamyl-tRNA synthetase